MYRTQKGYAIGTSNVQLGGWDDEECGTIHTIHQHIKGCVLPSTDLPELPIRRPLLNNSFLTGRHVQASSTHFRVSIAVTLSCWAASRAPAGIPGLFLRTKLCNAHCPTHPNFHSHAPLGVALTRILSCWAASCAPAGIPGLLFRTKLFTVWPCCRSCCTTC